MKHHVAIAEITLRRVFITALSGFLMPLLAACASSPPAPPSSLAALPGAMTVPYDISEAGHLILDISVNGASPKPFLVDSGANISAVYREHAASLDLFPTEDMLSVNGLVTSGLRPVIEDVTFQIGAKTFPLGQIITLDRQISDNDAVGLLGVDILADYTLQFDKEALMVTFIQSETAGRGHFSGWRKIPLKNRVKGYPDSGLYFASVDLKGEQTPVLIDTGSEISIVNWPLASLDPEMNRVKRRIRKQVKLEGVIDSVSLQMRTLFHDVALGSQFWPEVPVIIMDFDALTTIAPADEPLMIAGADLFTPSSFAFDFKNNIIYIRPEDRP